MATTEAQRRRHLRTLYASLNLFGTVLVLLCLFGSGWNVFEIVWILLKVAFIWWILVWNVFGKCFETYWAIFETVFRTVETVLKICWNLVRHDWNCVWNCCEAGVTFVWNVLRHCWNGCWHLSTFCLKLVWNCSKHVSNGLKRFETYLSLNWNCFETQLEWIDTYLKRVSLGLKHNWNG